MLGAIIGDIVGSRFEFGPAPEKGFKLFTDECNYTDDTICTIAIADAIMNKRDYGEALHDWCEQARLRRGAARLVPPLSGTDGRLRQSFPRLGGK